jgi:hypothetical protein
MYSNLTYLVRCVRLVLRVRLVLLVLRVLQDLQVLLVRLVFQLVGALTVRGVQVRLGRRGLLVLRVRLVHPVRLEYPMAIDLSARPSFRDEL